MKIRRFILLIIMALALVMPMNCGAVSDQPNVVIDELTVDVRPEVKNGKVTRIKEISNYTLSANRSDERAVLMEYYDNDAITIDKASSPGAKPMYVSAERPSIFYSGSRICALPVQLKAGKTSKATFERNYVKPEFFHGTSPAEPYTIKSFVFTVHIPKSLAHEPIIKEHNLPAGVTGTMTENGDERLYTLILENIPTPDSRELSEAPSLAMWWPSVDVNLSFAGVDELYAYLSALPEDISSPAEAVAAQAAEITAGLEDPQSKIDAIAAWVRQNIRYVAIEHGEWGHRPDAAAEVLRKRYADCKGSANLIAAMLRAVGIDGRRVWIGTRNSTPASWSELAALSCGNHMIAAAVMPDTTIFLDGTVKFAPNGYVPYDDAGQEVIIEDGASYILTRIPEADTDGNVLNYSGSLRVEADILKGSITLGYCGYNHVGVQNLLAQAAAGRTASVLNRLVCFDRKGMTASDIEVLCDNPNGDCTQLTATITDPHAVRRADGGAKLYVSVLPLRFFDMSPFAAKSRSIPFDMGTPHHFSTELTLAIPEGYEPEALPKTIALESAWFSGEVEYTRPDESTVKCRATLRMTATGGNGSDLEQWNRAVREVNKASNAPLIFTRSAQAQ